MSAGIDSGIYGSSLKKSFLTYGVVAIASFMLTCSTFPGALACHPESNDFHRCIHIFIERDLMTIQSYFEQFHYHGKVFRGRVLLEGPTLDEICGKVKDLEICMEEESAQGCFGFHDLEPLKRLSRALRAMQNFLCSGNKREMTAFLTHGGCIEEFRSRVCHDSRIEWPIVWAKIFRLEKGIEICENLFNQKECIIRHLPRSTCELEATDIFNKTMNTWLNAWCGTAANHSSATLICLTFIIVYKIVSSYGSVNS